MERWLPVVGYEGLYLVSDEGRVRGEARLVAHIAAGKQLRERLVRARVNKATGYLAVNLCRDGVRKTFTVHGLVAAAFLGPRPEGLEVCHEDGVRTNAKLSNLRYDTPQGNRDDSRRHGTTARGARLPQTKLTEAHVREIRVSTKLQRDLAREFGVSRATICRVKGARCWAHV